MYYSKNLISSVLVAALLIAAASADSLKYTLTKPRDNPLAPEFILQDTDGKQHTLTDYRGKIVVINFWASWCPPCRDEMPSLQKAAEQLIKHNIFILGINVGESRASVIRFLKSMPIQFPLLLDTKSEVMDSWSVPSIPTTIVINQEGRIVLFAVGEREWDDPKILQQIISIKKSP